MTGSRDFPSRRVSDEADDLVRLYGERLYRRRALIRRCWERMAS